VKQLGHNGGVLVRQDVAQFMAQWPGKFVVIPEQSNHFSRDINPFWTDTGVRQPIHWRYLGVPKENGLLMKANSVIGQNRNIVFKSADIWTA
jgi:hypothetical protein